MGAFTDARLVEACESILQDEPKCRKEGHHLSGSLTLKDLVLKLQQRFSIPVQAAALRKVLEHNQNAIVQGNVFEFLHVSKLDEQSVSGGSDAPKGAGKVQGDQGHGVRDAPAPLDERQHLASTFKDQKVEASDRAGDRPSKPGPLLPVASQPLATASQPRSASPEGQDKKLPAGKVGVSGSGTRKSVQESKENTEESLSVDMPMAQDPASAMNVIPRVLGKPLSGQIGGTKQEQSATGLVPPTDANARRHLPKAAEDQPLRTGPIKREHAGSVSQGAQAGETVRDSSAGSQGIQDQLEGLKLCQDQIKTLLAHRQSMEEQIASNLAAFAESPNHEAEARQLRAYLGQLSGGWSEALTKAQQAREASGRQAAPLISQHAALTDNRAAVCHEKQATRTGTQKQETVDLYDSDIEILIDSDAAKEQWAKAQKRKRKKEAATSDGESLAKRAKVAQEADQKNGGPARAQQEKEQEKASGLGGRQQDLVEAAAKAPILKMGDDIQIRVQPAPSQSSKGSVGKAASEGGGEAAALLLGASQVWGATTGYPDPHTVSTPRQLAQEPLAHRALVEEKLTEKTAGERLRTAGGDSSTQTKKNAALCQKAGDLGQRVRADAPSHQKAEIRDVVPSTGIALERTGLSEVKEQISKVQQSAPTETGGPSSHANGLEREAASGSEKAGNKACEARATELPANVQAENSKQRLGLQFPRRYRGDKPRRKAPRPEPRPPVNWNSSGQDEEVRKLLRAIFGSSDGAAPPFNTPGGWTLELKSPAALGGCIGSPPRDAQRQQPQQRKQSVPRSLADIRKGEK